MNEEGFVHISAQQDYKHWIWETNVFAAYGGNESYIRSAISGLLRLYTVGEVRWTIANLADLSVHGRKETWGREILLFGDF